MLDAINRPHLLITDAFNADYVQARRMQRDEQLLSKLNHENVINDFIGKVRVCLLLLISRPLKERIAD